MKKLLIITSLLIAGCAQENAEPKKEEMLCLFKKNPTQTNAGCIPNCPPYKTFDGCIEKWEAYKYKSKNGWIIEENCTRCD